MKKENLLLFIMGLVWGGSILFLYNQSIRLDESQSLWAATRSVPGLLRFISQDVHVPLYLVLLHFWVQIFGTSIIAARTLSLLFFALTIPFLYILGREAANRRVALLLVIFFSFS